MKFLVDFLHQEVPKSGGTMPAYYRKALFISEIVLAAYFLASAVMLVCTTGVWLWQPAVVFALTVICLLNINRMSARVNLICFSGIICVWLTWFVYRFGWSSGSPNILVPILPMVYFNIYEPPLGKIGYFVGIVAFRVILFAYSLHHTPPDELNHTASLVLQIVNSVIPLMMMTIEFILFSSSIQANERELTINNQTLHRAAGTDPLTGLPNRRAMLDEIEQYLRVDPNAQFSVAIADIDFFKRVNDTYGHNCGDYVLCQLAALFMQKSIGQYSVARWGGEEFCFFIPGKNIDDAGTIITDVCLAVKRMKFEFEGNCFAITLTAGVEESDYRSTLPELIERADHKLYMGKKNGRDQVVI